MTDLVKPDLVIDTPNVTRWVNEIRPLLQQGAEAMIAIGEKLAEARAATPDGEWGHLLRELDISDSWARRQMTVGRSAELRSLAATGRLPASMASLYALALAEDTEPGIVRRAVEAGAIRPSMTGPETANALRQIEKGRKDVDRSRANGADQPKQDPVASDEAGQAIAKCRNKTAVPALQDIARRAQRQMSIDAEGAAKLANLALWLHQAGKTKWLQDLAAGRQTYEQIMAARRNGDAVTPDTQEGPAEGTGQPTQPADPTDTVTTHPEPRQSGGAAVAQPEASPGDSTGTSEEGAGDAPPDVSPQPSSDADENEGEIASDDTPGPVGSIGDVSPLLADHVADTGAGEDPASSPAPTTRLEQAKERHRRDLSRLPKTTPASDQAAYEAGAEWVRHLNALRDYDRGGLEIFLGRNPQARQQAAQTVDLLIAEHGPFADLAIFTS
jgi:hypothetical protein